MRPVADIAKQRGTTVADVLAHLRRAGVALAEGQLEVDEDVVDKAYTKAHGIVVSNIRNYAFNTVPEHVFALAFALRAAFPILGRIRVKPLKPDSTATESAGNRPRQTAPAVPQNPRKRVCSIPKITNENLFSISAPCRRSHARLRQSGPIQLLFRIPFVKMAGN